MSGPIRPFERSLPMQLMRAREAVMARFRPHLKARDLSDQQWRIIRALSETDALAIAELSARCCIHPASLSRMLPALEQDGKPVPGIAPAVAPPTIASAPSTASRSTPARR